MAAGAPGAAAPAEEQVQRVVFNATLGRADGAAATYRASRMQAEGNMRVRIAMAQGDMPEGIAQLLNLMGQSLTREEEPPPPATEGAADAGGEAKAEDEAGHEAERETPPTSDPPPDDPVDDAETNEARHADRDADDDSFRGDDR